ncbi:MAG: histidine phosphatase family protein [Phycisphaeraceae bacterium]|nr:MAG: histidine phosphatase family protein [Phycisphaeraceae bacterium]
MRLVIVRHGKAKPDSASGLDFDRELRNRGVRQAEHLAGLLKGVQPPVSAVVSSRATRARQTAEVIAAGVGVEVAFDERLLVDEPVSTVLDLLRERADSGCLVLVGHNPQCEHLVATLTGRPVTHETRMRTGEAVVLEVNPAEPLQSGAELNRVRLEDDE